MNNAICFVLVFLIIIALTVCTSTQKMAMF